MLNQRLDAAKRLQEKLFDAEKAIDDAIASACGLSGAMPAARIDAKLSAIVGQSAVESAAASLAALVAARGHIVATHRHLEEARDSIGLRHFAAGTGFIKPDPNMGQGLAVVDTAA